MPMPLWWGKVNKRVFNPSALRNGKWDVITHIGRSSGKTYRTPLDAYEVDGTIVIVLVYGSRSDWVQHVLGSGTASLEKGGEVLDLSSPRLLTREAAGPLLEGLTKPPPGFLNVNEFLQMDIVSRRATQHELSSTV